MRCVSSTVDPSTCVSSTGDASTWGTIGTRGHELTGWCVVSVCVCFCTATGTSLDSVPGVVAAIVNSMKQHPEHALLQEQGCRALERCIGDMVVAPGEYAPRPRARQAHCADSRGFKHGRVTVRVLPFPFLHKLDVRCVRKMERTHVPGAGSGGHRGGGTSRRSGSRRRNGCAAGCSLDAEVVCSEQRYASHFQAYSLLHRARLHRFRPARGGTVGRLSP